MAIRKILRIGDSRLREKSEPVDKFGTPELDELVGDMLDTMTAADGAGLAAVQIGVPRRVMTRIRAIRTPGPFRSRCW